jgi:hypothetical protein
VIHSFDPRPPASMTRSRKAASPQRVAAEIKQAWLRDLRYTYWETHALRVTPTSLQLDVATMISEGDYYITGSINVGWAEPTDTPKDHQLDEV